MNYFFLFALLAVTVFGCAQKKSAEQPGENGDSGKKAGEPVTRLEFEIGRGSGVHVFDVDVDQNQLSISGPGGARLQSIAIPDQAEFNMLGGFRIDTLDYNFDGFMDFRFPVNAGSGGTWYSVWLFEPGKGKYEINQFLGDLSSPEVDRKNRTVVSHDIAGMAGMDYSRRTYEYFEGRYFLIRTNQQTAETPDGRVFRRTVTEIGEKNDRQITCEMVITFPDPKSERRVLLAGGWEGCGEDPYVFARGEGYRVEKIDGNDLLIKAANDLLKTWQKSRGDGFNKWVDAETGCYVTTDGGSVTYHKKWDEVLEERISFSEADGWFNALKKTDPSVVTTRVGNIYALYDSRKCEYQKIGAVMDPGLPKTNRIVEIYLRQQKTWGGEPDQALQKQYEYFQNGIDRRMIAGFDDGGQIFVANLYWSYVVDRWVLTFLDFADRCYK